MRRQIGISIFIAQAFFFATIQGFAQQTPVQQSPSIPEDVLGLRLIAWSHMQKPEPVMQGQSQQPQPVQQSDPPSSPTPALIDRTNADRANQGANRGLANGSNRFADRGAQH
jgi:hypothetical protein